MTFSRWSEGKKEQFFWLCLIAVLGAVAAWLSQNFLTSPRPWLDEGIYVQAARHLAETGRFGLPVEPEKDVSLAFVTVGFPVIVPVAVAFTVFGTSLVTARVVAVFFVLLAIASGSVLAKKLYGRRAATWTMVLLGTFSPLFGHGKNVLGEVPGLAYLFISLLLFGRFPFLFGLVFGLAIVSKPTFLPLLPALAVALAVGLYRREIAWRNIWVVLAGIVLLLLGWVWTQFRGESLASVLGHYANPYQLENMAAVVSANIAGFFTQATPLHFLALVLFAVIGFGVRGVRRIRPVEWVLIIFILLIWGSYFRTAGWYRYFFPAHLPLLLLAPAMLVALSSRVRVCGRWCVTLACLLLLGANVMALAKDPAPLYGTTWQDVVAAVGAYGPTADIMYLTAPEIAFFHPTETYRQYLDVTDALALGTAALTNAIAHPPDAVVVGKQTANIEPLLAAYRLERTFGGYSLWIRK